MSPLKIGQSQAQNSILQRQLYLSAFRVGDALEGSDPKRSESEYSVALTTAKPLVRQDYDVQRLRDLAFIYPKMGDLFLSRGLKEEDLRAKDTLLKTSLDYYNSALVIYKGVAVSNPDNPTFGREVATTTTSIATVLAALNKMDDAVLEYNKAIKIEEGLVAAFPENGSFRSNLSNGFRRLGNLYQQNNKPNEALEFYKRALSIRADLAKENPTNAAWQSALAFSYVDIGDVLVKNNDTQAAIDNYRSALEIRQQLKTQNPMNSDYTRYVEGVQDKLQGLLKAQSTASP